MIGDTEIDIQTSVADIESVSVTYGYRKRRIRAIKSYIYY